MRPAGIVIGLLLVAFCLVVSIAFGKQAISLSEVYRSIFEFNGSREHLIVRTVRVPRALIAMAVGACLAMAGAIMQAVTRNALAGPELFGVNQGAAFLIVIHLYLMGGVSGSSAIAYAFVGAGAAGLTVYLLGTMGASGLTPLKLIVAGATINLLLGALTQGILVFDERSLDTMRFWLAGSLTGRSTSLFAEVAPYMLIGVAGALIMGRQINLLSLGEETAQGLGLRTGLVKALSLLAVVLLAGSSVAIAGPIGFVGLAVPHIVRYLVGQDYRWVLPYSALAGAALLLTADIAARFIVPSQEVSAGVVTAVLGAPFLIYLAQRRA
ncbi:iron ABC transporter [Cohnella sp. CIP 111063]|uniref:FecCD family ABC transporter permease n=1 Tax=unclassified Cohnella TaxID=2636738 RepID=UPI000B8C288C|nr:MULTISPECIES: iron ABC transporter permease [unclassified Cohnella]OXS58377.1 iron ABC transporter [Cohnella sp. CIP 111063]PRX71664.1 iron complex transport system permease protein [Cohnella sp. SGD-V74]